MVYGYIMARNNWDYARARSECDIRRMGTAKQHVQNIPVGHQGQNVEDVANLLAARLYSHPLRKTARKKLCCRPLPSERSGKLGTYSWSDEGSNIKGFI